jgi:isopenicillin N synthase-like dioxygenase
MSRLDMRKLVDGGVAGRRESVAVVGDALREEGGVRVEGYADVDGVVGDRAAMMSAVAQRLLEAMAEYFGLAEASFEATPGIAVAVDGEAATRAVLARSLLVVVPEVPAGVEVRRAVEGWVPVAARPGEILVLPGDALATFTREVVPPTDARWPAKAAVEVVEVRALAGAPREALSEFAEAPQRK